MSIYDNGYLQICLKKIMIIITIHTFLSRHKVLTSEAVEKKVI